MWHFNFFQLLPTIWPGVKLEGPGETSWNYAEAVADGVHDSAGFLFRVCPPSTEAPVATLHHFHEEARKEVGHVKVKTQKKNASRDAHHFLKKWGLCWRVPMTFMNHELTPEVRQVAFIKPVSFFTYLLGKAPELLMGGCRDIVQGQVHLRHFWESYEKCHPDHKIFVGDQRRRETTVPLSLHGDEGRGRKKSNTTIVSMEACIGVDSWAHMVNKRSACDCSSCEANSASVKRTRLAAGGAAVLREFHSNSSCAFQRTNLTENSYLTKYVLAILPVKDLVLLQKLAVEITESLKKLFEEGVVVNGERWYAACVGYKGDLKWHQKCAKFTRSSGSQIKIGAAMCHECQAGLPAYPFEDFNHQPSWAPTMWTIRPYPVEPIWTKIPYERVDAPLEGPSERFFKRDVFHISRVGVLRYFAASCVLLLIKLRYFNERAENDRSTLLMRAHSNFVLFCRTNGRTPALRSFTDALFNCSGWSSYAWINCKASDAAHIVAWIQVLVSGFLNDPLDQAHLQLLELMRSAAMHARAFHALLYDHGAWLPVKCAWVLYHHIHKFQEAYNGLAYLSMREFQYTGFAKTGKFHQLSHVKFDLLQQLLNPGQEWVSSPNLYSCEMNEDVIGKISRLNRKVSSQRSAERTFQLYLTKSKAVHRRFIKSLRQVAASTS